MQPELIIVGGPNGCGKTTYAMQYLVIAPFTYLGADAIATEISPHDVASASIQAGRLFIERFEQLLADKASFVMESTLSGVSLQKQIRKARNGGYRVSIMFFFTDAPDTCIARIRQRVRRGGHHVPDDDVRRRYARAFHNFWHIYRILSDEWVIMYNGQQGYSDVASGDDLVTNIEQAERFAFFRQVVRGSQNGK